MPGAAVTPLFIEGARGRLFALYHTPAEAPGTGAAALFLPAFAEEMNRSRRMFALQARALAERGVAALVLDPYGTGDSAGDFAAARWQIWRADAQRALDWLRAYGHGEVAVLGLRLGACLALELAAAAAPAVSRAVLWSPVVRGAAYLTQFLRVRTAAGIGARAGAAGETTQALRDRLLGGETLEVAGYALAPELAAAIEAVDIVALGRACRVPLVWIDLVAQAGARPAPASAAALEALRAGGLALEAMTALGEPFWAIEETVIAPDLIARTAALWEPCPA